MILTNLKCVCSVFLIVELCVVVAVRFLILRVLNNNICLILRKNIRNNSNELTTDKIYAHENNTFKNSKSLDKELFQSHTNNPTVFCVLAVG